MSYWFMYWFTRLDAINGVFEILTIFGAISTLIGVAAVVFLSVYTTNKTVHDYDESMAALKIFKKVLLYAAIPLLIIGAAGVTFVPTTKEAAVIYLVPKIVNNEELQKIPDNFLKLINKKMDSYFNDVLEEKSEELKDN